MDLFKILIFGIFVSIVALILKQIKPEYSIIVIIVGSIIFIGIIIGYLSTIFDFFQNIIIKTNIDSELFTVVLKVIGIAYVVEFSAGICRDSGNTSIADKLILVGKLVIVIMSLPIINNLFHLIMENI